MTKILLHLLVRNFLCIIIAAIMHCATTANAQSYSDCKVDGGIFVKTEQPAKYKSSLQQYFEWECKDKFDNFSGTINLTILIDSSGKACCSHITNNNSPVNSKEIKAIVNRMKRWVPAMYHSVVVNYSAAIQLVFYKSKLYVNYLNEY